MKRFFVFGSNKAGIHGAGAAKYAVDHHGAIKGIGEGLQGNSYAIPTKGFQIECLPFAEIDAAIVRFIKFARSHPEFEFHLTPVGTGLAGHKKSDVWQVLERETLPKNVVLTSSWTEKGGW